MFTNFSLAVFSLGVHLPVALYFYFYSAPSLSLRPGVFEVSLSTVLVLSWLNTLRKHQVLTMVINLRCRAFRDVSSRLSTFPLRIYSPQNDTFHELTFPTDYLDEYLVVKASQLVNLHRITLNNPLPLGIIIQVSWRSPYLSLPMFLRS